MEVYVLIQKFKENDREFIKDLSAIEKFFPVLELFEEEFEHFDFAKSYTYLFDAFPLLLISKYKAFKHKEEAYKRFQMLRLSIRKLLLNIVEKYLEVLKRHISKNYDYLDELLYYDRVLQVLFNNGKERLFLKEIQTLEEVFENALEHHPFLGEKEERYTYFIQKWLVFLLKEKRLWLMDEPHTETLSTSLEELTYQYHLPKKFSVPVQKESEFKTSRNWISF